MIADAYIGYRNTSGQAKEFKDVNGKPRVSSMPYLYDIAEGNVADHTVWSKTGYNGDIDSGTEDLWNVGGTYAFPVSAAGLEVTSTGAAAANDTSDGSGIRSVIITYLDNTYTEKTEVLALSGTGIVPTVALNILRVNNFRAYTVGAGKVAAGTISIRHLTDTPIYSQIAIGNTRARNAAYTVPLGKTLYIVSATFSSISAATGMDALFTVRATYDDKRAVVLDFFMPIIEVGIQDGAISLPFEVPIRLPATTDIKVAATTGNNNAVCSSILRGWLE